jgi:flagellar motor switch protein FliN
MSGQDVTPQEALTRLGASTAEAVAQVLETYAPGLVERGDVSVLPDSQSSFANLPFGAVAASVSYVDGVTGANVFVMSPNGARALAAAMMGMPPPEPEEPEQDEDGKPKPIELSELELSAVAECANQMMAAAASAISVVLGQEVAISPPDTRVVDDTQTAIERYGTAPHACSTSFAINGETCRLVQLVPAAFVVRMARAIDELSEQQGDADAGAGVVGSHGLTHSEGGVESIGLEDALTGIRLRVWAELGRTKIPLGRALELPLGAVVDLDCTADAPVNLYVNGLLFAQGRLLVTDEGEWAVRLESLGGPDPSEQPPGNAQPQIEGAVS